MEKTTEYYKMQFEYAQLKSNDMVTIRLPKKLKEDFIASFSSDASYSKYLKKCIADKAIEYLLKDKK